jgi:hypothetical protein
LTIINAKQIRICSNYIEENWDFHKHGDIMEKKADSELLGKVVFYATGIAMLAFFWWLLIYDHGVVSTH